MYDPNLAAKSKIEMKIYHQELKALEALRAGEPEPNFKKKRLPPPDDGKGLPPACIRKGTVVKREAKKAFLETTLDERIKAERLEHKEAQAQKNLQAINSAQFRAEMKKCDHASGNAAK
ncbi:hypothetical protein J4E91_004461 [Alternaria rosae]|nr:hypothetical protein J4E91_004461 [Alternaria rosae]